RTAPTNSSISPIVATASGPPGRTRFVVGSNPIVANTSPATGRRVAISSRFPSSTVQPDHIASNEISVPSLSKTTRSIASRIGWRAGVMRVGAPGGRSRASGFGDRLLNGRVGARPSLEDQRRIGREGDGDRVPDGRRREARIVELVE